MSKEVVKNRKFSRLKTTLNKLDKTLPDAAILIHINQYYTDNQNLEKKTGDVDKKHLMLVV